MALFPKNPKPSKKTRSHSLPGKIRGRRTKSRNTQEGRRVGLFIAEQHHTALDILADVHRVAKTIVLEAILDDWVARGKPVDHQDLIARLERKS